MRVCKKMVIYLGIKTPQSRKERKYTWQKNARISCSRNDCKYTWEKTAGISRHNFETNGRPYASSQLTKSLRMQGLETAVANTTAESLNIWLIKFVEEQSLISCNSKCTACVILK